MPLRDPAAENLIAAAYASDPGAAIGGAYINTTEGIRAAARYGGSIRLLVVGNRADNSRGPGVPMGPLCTPLRTPGTLSRPSITH